MILLYASIVASYCSATFVQKRTDGGKPGQVHLSYYNETVRSVSWVTFENVTQYLYVKDAALGPYYVGDEIYPALTEYWTEPQNKSDHRFTHHAVFQVESGKTYDYFVGSATASTDRFTFSTRPSTDSDNVELLIYGDMGLENAQTHQIASKMIKYLDIDMIMHIGDLCYNLYEDNGTKTDTWMEFIEPIATQVPYQTIPGNHEAFFNFTHYESRYKWVSEQGNPHYYSYDIGPVHVLAYSTEYYYFDEDKSWGKQRLLDQLSFVKKDLARAAANRDNVPWIVTIGHRPMYCSNGNHGGACLTQDTPHRNGSMDGIPIGLEDTFHEYGVDVCFSGHEHSYERTLPLYQYKEGNGNNTDNELFTNPAYPIHVVTGAAGNREGYATFADPKPDWSVMRQDDYSVSLVRAHRHEFSFYQVDKDAKMIDTFKIVKTKH